MISTDHINIFKYKRIWNNLAWTTTKFGFSLILFNLFKLSRMLLEIHLLYCIKRFCLILNMMSLIKK